MARASSSYSKLKVILDVDTGIDDSHAIMLALTHPDVEVLAITCVNGNLGVDDVCDNTLRVLKTCNKEDIPVYRGAECSILGKATTSHDPHYDKDPWNTPVDKSLIQKEAASNALIRIISENPGEITVVALAPLTNLALALRIDATISQKIKQLYIMGGNIEARGWPSPCAELNFYKDPEAAYVVLKEFNNFTILPYEVCNRTLLPWDFIDKWIEGNTAVSDFLSRSIGEICKKEQQSNVKGYITWDGYAMAMVIDSTVIVKQEHLYIDVELSGQLSRGLMVVDWFGTLKQPCNAQVVTELDRAKIESLLLKMIVDCGQ